MITSLIPSFNSGELSPLIHLRSDLDKYRSGCRTLLNMLITPYGGVRRRPGLEHMGEVKDSTKRTRLGRFQYSIDDAYILELGNHSLRFWQNGEPIVPATSPAWLTATAYPLDAYVLQGGNRYRCISAHTSGTFATDLAAGKWVLATVYEITSPWSSDEIFRVQVAQVNNIAYLVHPAHLPYKLTREASDDWDLLPLAFDYAPMRDENTDEDFTITVDFPINSDAAPWITAGHVYEVGDRVTYTGKTWVCDFEHTSSAPKAPGAPGATYAKPLVIGRQTAYRTLPIWVEAFADNSSTVGQTVTLVAAAPIFDSGQVGGYFELSKNRGVDDYEVDLKLTVANDGAISTPVVIQGKWSINTFGTWIGTVTVQRSDDRGVTWTDLRAYQSDGDRNISQEFTEPTRVLLRMRWNKDSGGTPSSNPRAVLGSVDGYIRGVVQILTVTDATHATATTISPVEKMTTYYWSEGSWSDFRGFPRTVTVHEQRIVYGGNADQSQALWASKVDKYEDFQRGVVDTDAWTHSLAASEQNAIQWLLSQKSLLVGTSGGEWVLASSKDDTPITPSNVRARRHSGHGSEFLPATLVNDVTLFIQRGGRKLRELAFSFEADGYVTQDLTMLAEHVTEGGIVETSFQAQRDAILWCIAGNGQLLGLTYERAQNVVGWHRHTTAADGIFESVAVLATPGEEDEVWVVVRRAIGGQQRRYIERFRPDQFRAQAANNLTDLFFVDSGRKITGSNLTEMTGLEHLEGQQVQVVADGAVCPSRLVSGGKITLNNPLDPQTASVIIAGLGYESQLEPMALEVGLQNGTSVGRQKRIHEVFVYLNQTAGGRYGPYPGGDKWDTINTSGTELGQPAPLFTGGKTLSLDHRSDLDASFVISQTGPQPMTILAVVPKWNVYGDDN